MAEHAYVSHSTTLLLPRQHVHGGAWRALHATDGTAPAAKGVSSAGLMPRGFWRGCCLLPNRQLTSPQLLLAIVQLGWWSQPG